MPRTKAEKLTVAPKARMPETRRSSGSPRKRNEEVIEAAATVFADRGFHGATTQDIADQLQIRQATLYYYFPSKDAALELVCLRGVEGFVERAESILAVKSSVQEQIVALVRGHLQFLEEKQSFVRVFLTERQHLRDEARKRVGKLSRRYEQIIQSVFESGIESGAIRADLNCRFATLGLLALCNSVAAWYGKEPGVTVASASKAFAELIWNGVGVVATGARRDKRS